MVPKIALLVGNGFSMSFGAHTGLSKHWDTQSFFNWEIPNPTSETLLIDLLPNLKALKKSLIEQNDFEIFKYLQNASYCKDMGINQEQCLIEARHYLTIAFSHLALEQLKCFDATWAWFNWLKKHRDNIVGALSLNYDLLLEQCLNDLSMLFDSCQVNGHGNGITLSKPHGSVDFEILGIKCPVSYPLNGRIDLNNTPIYRLNSQDLLYPRTQPLCIVPNEKNKYIDFQWVTSANDKFQSTLKDCSHLVVIGVSYFECDIPEIDDVLAKVPPSCEIILANPNPPQNMLTKLAGRSVTLWQSYDGPINKDGDFIMLKDLNTGKVLRKCFCGSERAYQYCCSI